MHACPQRVEQAAEQKELEAAELVAQGIAVDPREKQQQLQPSRPAVAVTAGPFLIQSLVPELEGMDLGQGLAQAPQVQQQQQAEGKDLGQRLAQAPQVQQQQAESVDLGQGLAQAQQQQQPPQQAEGVEVPGVGREQQGVGEGDRGRGGGGRCGKCRVGEWFIVLNSSCTFTATISHASAGSIPCRTASRTG